MARISSKVAISFFGKYVFLTSLFSISAIHRHPFWLFLLERMRSTSPDNLGVERIGGSIFLSNAFDDWESDRKRNELLIDFVGPCKFFLTPLFFDFLCSNYLSL